MSPEKSGRATGGEEEVASVLRHKKVMSSKRELWLFRVPENFDASSLSGFELKVPAASGELGPTNLLPSSSSTFGLDTVPAVQSEASQMVSVFPSESGSSLVTGKPFTRQVCVREVVLPPSHVKFPRPNPPVAQIKHLPGKVIVSGSGRKGLPATPSGGGGVIKSRKSIGSAGKRGRESTGGGLGVSDSGVKKEKKEKKEKKDKKDKKEKKRKSKGGDSDSD